MTEQPVKNKAEFIQPDAYPQMMSKQNAIRALQTLQSAQVALKAQTAMNSYGPMLRDVIMDYVEGLEQAGTDMAMVFAVVHEMRGFAETAGMATTGRIAEILCRYMDEMDRVKKPVDATIVALHVAAIGRAARADQNDVQIGDTVAAELNALVTLRLAEIGVR
jgi:hypothetical protein